MSNAIYHYVYRITNIILNKHYYGKRSSNIIPKLDLGIRYFSSSYDKDFIIDQKANPQNYKYKVIYIFDEIIKALLLEIKLHNKFNVGVNNNFYNKVKQTTTGFDSTGITMSEERRQQLIISKTNLTPSEETRKKISDTLKAKNIKLTPEHKQKLIIANTGNTNRLGKTISEESKQKVSIANKGKVLTPEHKQKISIANTGKTRTEETLQKMSIVNTGKVVSNVTKQKISASMKGREFSDESKQKMSNSKKGSKHTPEAKQKMSDNKKGSKHTPEAKKKNAEASAKKYKLLNTITKEETIIENLKQWCLDRDIKYHEARSLLKNGCPAIKGIFIGCILSNVVA
jgi:hypothetical protein